MSELTGITPCEFTPQSGSYQLTVSKVGFTPVVQAIEYDSAAGLDVTVTLQPLAVDPEPVLTPATSSALPIVALAGLAIAAFMMLGGKRARSK